MQGTHEFVENPFIIYPNPSQGSLTIETEEIIESVELLNLQGSSLVKSYTLPLDYSNIKKGVYLLRVNALNRNYIQQVILK